MNTFEEYLKIQHQHMQPEILDDDLPDAFDKWLVELQVDEIIKYADQWHEELEAIRKATFN